MIFRDPVLFLVDQPPPPPPPPRPVPIALPCNNTSSGGGDGDRCITFLHSLYAGQSHFSFDRTRAFTPASYPVVFIYYCSTETGGKNRKSRDFHSEKNERFGTSSMLRRVY